MEAVMSQPTTFGGRLRQFREDAGLTQEQLASRANITPLSVIRYESDQRVPSWDVVLELAAALGKTPNDFAPPNSSPRPLGKRK